MADWESVRVRAAHLARAVSLGRHQGIRCAFAHTCSINPMRRIQIQARPVVLRSATRTGLDGQSGLLQTLVQRPSCAIDRRCILERLLGFGVQFRMSKLCCGLRAFARIARFARQREVADAI